jgi:hypothetical protein
MRFRYLNPKPFGNPTDTESHTIAIDLRSCNGHCAQGNDDSQQTQGGLCLADGEEATALRAHLGDGLGGPLGRDLAAVPDEHLGGPSEHEEQGVNQESARWEAADQLEDYEDPERDE